MSNVPIASQSRFNFAQYVTAPSASRHQESVALTMIGKEGREVWTWAHVWDRMARWQNILHRQHLPDGARVQICLPNCPDIPALMLAAGAMRYIPVVLSPQLSAEELRFIAKDCGAALCVGGPAFPDVPVRHLHLADVQEELNDIPRRNARPHYCAAAPNDPAYMVYTSGTTGRPRGVLHAHRAVLARQMMFDGWTGITPSDIILHSGQLNWTYAMGIAIFDAWARGAHSIIYEGPRSAQTWAHLIAQTQATIFAAVPGIYRQMLRDVPDLRTQTQSLRHALCAGEPLLASLWQQWHETTQIPLYEALGMSECSTYISSGPQTPTRPGSPGRAQKGRRIAILPLHEGLQPVAPGQSGMLAIHQSDPGLMLAYYGDDAATQAAFRGPWFLTGDIAAIDADGYLHYHGRGDDIINALGYRVGPVEVESALAPHPAIDEIAVSAHTPRAGVTLVCAHLVLAADTPWTPALENEIRAMADTALATYKRPRVYRIHDALPRNRSGKILRRALAD